MRKIEIETACPHEQGLLTAAPIQNGKIPRQAPMENAAHYMAGLEQSDSRSSMISRRRFLVAGGSGLCLMVLSSQSLIASNERPGPVADTVSAYLEITPEGEVIITTPMCEMGQGITHSLPLILAEELEADWTNVRVVLSPGDPLFASPAKGTQATGRSMSVRGYYDVLREVGAAARVMLQRAAANAWHVPEQEVSASRGHLFHDPSGRTAGFGAFARQAALLEPPASVTLKPSSQFRLIGSGVKPKGLQRKVVGQAQYTIDMKMEGMLNAAVVMAPVVGARPARVDGRNALAMPGVRHIVQFGDKSVGFPYAAGVAVVADSFWQAQQGSAALAIEWIGGDTIYDSASDAEARSGKTFEEGTLGLDRGRVDSALESASHRIDVTYEVPYLAHATMEPMTCVAHVEEGACTLWAASQGPELTRSAVAQALGLSEENVTLNRLLAGGGFGRRYYTDFAVQAAVISQAVGAPVKVIWSREEDMQHDYYRPAQTMRLRGGCDADGRLSALHAKSVGPSLINWGRSANRLGGRADPTSFSGISNTRYDIEHLRTEWVSHETPVPIGLWRSVGHSCTGFFFECAIDEMAHAASRDPFEFRRELLRGDARLLRVLTLAANKAGWHDSLPDGRGRGIATMGCYGTFVAHVAEVSIVEGAVKVHRIDVALDCGIAIDPDTIAAQMEGGTLFALSAALYGEVAFQDGKPQVSNFDDYPVLRFPDAPPVYVHRVHSAEAPGGIGECAVPTTMASVANAVFAASGKRLRRLPLAKELTA